MSKKIRLALIIDEAKIGGGQKHLFWLAKYLGRERFEITVLCGGEGFLTENLKREGISYFALPGKLNFRSVWKLRKLIKELKPHIVHTHGTVAGVWGRLAALKFRRPKLVHTLHGIHYLNFPGSLKFVLGVWSEKFLSSFTDMTICVSESDLKKGREHKLFQAKKSTVIRNGIEAVQADRTFDASRKRRELGLAEDNFVVGSIGRLDIAKGYTYLLAAASLLKEGLPRARFVIAGDGPLKNFLQAQQSKLGLNDTVIFLGTRLDAPELLQIFDVLVLPSLWEGMPLILLEGMQAGKAIVASDI
ncbi:MAG: glycosyltransferase, partial [candidate division Zixibacteria bacterium]|nr:glycosyltransferase [candidate division Zixibacteria bacterium]